jgi:hypothetical protein
MVPLNQDIENRKWATAGDFQKLPFLKVELLIIQTI